MHGWIITLKTTNLESSSLYRVSMMIKTLYYQTDAEIYNSYIQLELL